MALTKAEIVQSIINRAPMPREQASATVEILLEIIKHTLESGEDVLVSRFGKFCVKEKRKRRGRNPATGDSLMIAPKRVITFQCSGILRDRINS